jgi:uncharacterized protein
MLKTNRRQGCLGLKMANSETRPEFSLLLFFLLSFLFVFVLALPAILYNYGVTAIKVPFEPFLILGSWTPNIAAFLIIAFVFKKKGGISALIRRWLMWRVSPFWYLIALSPLLISALAAGIYHLADGTPPEVTEPVSPGLLFALLILALITGAMGEELGWRGFALPRMQSAMSAFTASVILGTIWGFWHLPLWFAGLGWEDMSFTLFTYNCVAISVIMTWICNNTYGNMMLITIMHLSYNFGWNLMNLLWQVPMDQTLIYQAILLTVYAVVVLIIYGPGRLSKKQIPIDEQDYSWSDP